jgi:putative tryptophan/tyrosine transport system substrate-binding protein
MRRREFIGIVAGSAVGALPLTVRAQQPLPVIGFFSNASADEYTIRLDAFRQGLQGAGFVEGQNVTIEYRWADGDNSRLQTLAAELVNRHVAVLVAGGGTPAAMTAKAVTSTIPIIFAVSIDPVAVGLVRSLNQPGGNMTGISNMNVQMAPKKLEVVRELIPVARLVGVLLNPSSSIGDAFVGELKPAAKAMGIQLRTVNADREEAFEPAFAELTRQKVDALLIGPDFFLNTRIAQLARLALRHRVPAVFSYRPFVAAGGLISFGPDENEYYRLVGTYAGRVLKGDKPADLPVQQSTKVELIINLKTARALGITVPLSLLGRADEVIE